LWLPPLEPPPAWLSLLALASVDLKAAYGAQFAAVKIRCRRSD
jgi:hypothetical protein